MINSDMYEAIMLIENKTERVMRYIQAVGYVNRSIAALDCEVSKGTVARAVKVLRDMGALEGDNFTGRWVPADEVAALFDGLPRVVNVEHVAHCLYADSDGFYQSLNWAEKCSMIRRVNGNGNMYLQYVAV